MTDTRPPIDPDLVNACLKGFAISAAAGLKFGPKPQEVKHWATNYAYLLQSAGITDPERIIARFSLWATGNDTWPSASNVIQLRHSEYQPHRIAAHQAPQIEHKADHLGPTENGLKALAQLRQLLGDRDIGTHYDPAAVRSYRRINGIWHRIEVDEHGNRTITDLSTLPNSG